MSPFLSATLSLKNHIELPKVAQLAKKSPNLVTLNVYYYSDFELALANDSFLRESDFALASAILKKKNNSIKKKNAQA
jgi:hypothetical protein